MELCGGLGGFVIFYPFYDKHRLGSTRMEQLCEVEVVAGSAERVALCFS
jgi:hypothetical protein